MTERSAFLAALEIPDPAARAAYLDEACGADPVVRGRVEALLAAHDEAGSFMAQPAADRALPETIADLDRPDPDATGPDAGLAGTLLAGRYMLGEEIGRGGMGTVYRAEQLRPVRRSVAVKLVNPGMDSRTVLARFEAERQALALMDHPHIAKVLDAGATPDGRPFFVMELVGGVPLTQDCDARRLPVADRLDLFLRICRAVQHAHRKGIIHRDLKPSNVLIEDHGGRPSPKVIDFGLAKAVGGTVLTEQTLHTAHMAVAGSPLYMAPEQAGTAAGDVDIRADVYALGAVLYELLTGSTPIPRDALKQAALAEVLRLIREDDPPPPSRRLVTADALPSIAAGRRTEPSRLVRLVRGDLDLVVMKALEKDRDRRYESVAALAADVDRFLNHEPVAAGPPTAAYRLRKFARRHRAAVTAAGLVLLALVVGVVGTALGLVEARRQATLARTAAFEEGEARRAEAEQRRQAVIARRRADDEADIARRIGAILTEALIGQADPARRAATGRAPDPDLKVRTLLDEVAARVDGHFVGKPATEAVVRLTIGRSYQGLGLYPEAIRHLEQALDLSREAAPPTKPATARPPCPCNLDAADLQRAPAFEAVTGAVASEDVAMELATAYRRAHRLDRAERLNREFLERLEAARGPDDPDVLTFGYNLGVIALALGRLDAAETRLARALEGRESTCGPDSFHAAQARTALGALAAERRDFGRALDLHARALEVYRRVLSADAPETLIVANNLADTLAKLGRTAEAIEAFDRLVAAARRSLGPNHIDTLTYMNGLANGYLDARKYDLAEPLLREVVEAARATLPEAHPDAVSYKYNLGCLFEDTGRYDEADRELTDALGLSRRAHPAGHRMTVQIAQHLIDVRFAAGRAGDAEPLVRELLALYEGRQPDHWITSHLRGLLGRAALARGRYDDAEPLLLAGYRGLTERLAKLPPAFRVKRDELSDHLAELYTRWEKPAEAAKWRAERGR